MIILIGRCHGDVERISVVGIFLVSAVDGVDKTQEKPTTLLVVGCHRLWIVSG